MRGLSRKQFRKEVETFLAFKRALGWVYLTGEAVLRHFEDFALANSEVNSQIDLANVIPVWLERKPARKPITLSHELSIVRQFCLYLHRSDPRTFVPAARLAPRTKSSFVPYMLSLEDVRRLVHGADQVQKGTFWHSALRMLLIATYCTGLRPGEAARLQRDDLDQAGRVLHVRDSKGRSRDLPFQEDLAREFARYLRERTELLHASGRFNEAALFVDINGRAITTRRTSTTFRLLARRLGMKSQRGRSGPRPYDLRHAFAVHRLTTWYHAGIDVNARLPWLSAYMGHADVLDTEVYLHATPELLELASKKFAARFAGAGGRS